MLESPFNFEPRLSSEDYRTIGRLSLKWSHIENILGNCLKVLLRLSDAEAIIVVFPLTAEHRLNKIKNLDELSPMNAEAKAAFDQLDPIMRALLFVRNNTTHAVAVENAAGEYDFHLRSKNRCLTKAQIFSVEELTNCAAHAAYSLRFALGFKTVLGARHTLPERPEIPEFLLNAFPGLRVQKKAKP